VFSQKLQLFGKKEQNGWVLFFGEAVIELLECALNPGLFC
jgi:hypothetical protein